MSWAGIQKKIQIENNGERRKIEFVPSKNAPPHSSGNGKGGHQQDGKKTNQAMIKIKNKEKTNEIYSMDSLSQSVQWKSIRR
jgi:hypothetical protein